jgi:3-phosphoshikimate 1-carboxyvinyltransferase
VSAARSSPPAEIVVGGARPLVGRLRVPGDKSISHRALLFAALGHGRSRIANLASGDDVAATRAALAALGVRMHDQGSDTVVEGFGFDALREPDDVLDCRNSGTTMRVLAGVLAGRPFLSVLSGDASLRARPMARVVQPLRAMGAAIDGRDDGRRAPLAIRGGALHGVDHTLPVASAQVKSALILAGLQATGSTRIVEPAQSRDHTERMLAELGGPVRASAEAVVVEAGAWSGFELDVPADPSSAAFFAVGAAITPGSDLVLEGVALNPTRLGFVDVLRRMGAVIDVVGHTQRIGEPVGDIHVRHAPLHATTIAGDEIPCVLDEIPALAIAAAFADGVTEIRDAAELVVKESNRIGTIGQELAQLGIESEARPDGLVIRGGTPRSASLKSHGDHRIAMAGAIAANALAGESRVRGWRAVGASYPAFDRDLAAVTQA